jgi:hypothetical protein
MTICIPLASETNNDYLDLRFALRGFEIYVKPDKIYVIGGMPGWIQGVEHITATDRPEAHQRERNMFEKLLLCPEDEFLMAHDDHFLMAPWQEQYGWDVSLLNKFYSLSRNSNYKKTVANTIRVAPKGNNFDIHVPMTMQRSLLYRMRSCRWDLPWGLCVKSIFSQFAGIKGRQMEDCKFRTPFILKDLKGRDWFSTADGVIDKCIPLMDKIYPKKSKFEI